MKLKTFVVYTPRIESPEDLIYPSSDFFVDSIEWVYIKVNNFIVRLRLGLFLRREIADLAIEMEKKMRKHDKTRGNGSQASCLGWKRKLTEETSELRAAYKTHDPEQVTLECADVANCAAFISSSYRREQE